MDKALKRNGDCYESALKFVMDNDHEDYEVCHGIVGGFEVDGVWIPRHGHAWVEVNRPFEFMPDEDFWVCIDRANGKDAELPRDVYYKFGVIDSEEIVRYSRIDALKQAASTGNFGPWAEELLNVDDGI